jgi:oxygen-independent coproporphyrinogen-3 oxidase
MTGAHSTFIASRKTLTTRELPAEFVLNALRLNSGFSLRDYSARTGLSPSSLQPQLDRLIEKKLLVASGERVGTTKLGSRFLDTVIAEFLPD